MKTRALRRKHFFRRTFVKLFLLHLLLCAGAFSDISLCFNQDGSFHVEFFPCEKTGGSNGDAGIALPIKTSEYTVNPTSDPCDSCEESYVFICAEDCKNLTLPNAGGNLRDLLPASTIQTPVFITKISNAQSFNGLRQPIAAIAAIDSLQTVVLLN